MKLVNWQRRGSNERSIYATTKLIYALYEPIQVGGLSGGAEFPTEEEEGGDAEDDEDEAQGRDVQGDVCVVHVQLLQGRGRTLEVAVRLSEKSQWSTIFF